MHPALRHFYYSSSRGGSPEDVIGVNTTSDGKQAFLIVGDSTAAGKGRTLGPTTEAETMYLWNGTDLTEITTDDISTIETDGPFGTQYKQMAIDHKANFGRKSVFVNQGSSGAEFYPNGDTNNWYTTGVLYDAAVTEAEDCLTHLGLTKFRAIIVSLGVNDARGAQTLVNIDTAIDSLFTRLIADFPDTPILLTQMGRTDASFLNARIYHIRQKLRTVVQNNADVHFVGNMGAFFKRGVTADYYDVENLHLDQAGNNILGSMYARWFKNHAYSKMGRCVISSHFDELTPARKSLVDTFISSQVTDGNYWLFDTLHPWVTSEEDNIYFDWSFITAPTDNIATAAVIFNENDSIETDGVNDTMVLGYDATLVNDTVSSQNDIIVFVKVKENLSSVGAEVALFGRRSNSSSPGISLVQTSTFLQWRVNDNTANSATVNRFENNTAYSVARTGASKRIIINDEIDVQGDVASTGEASGTVLVGVFRDNNVNIQPMPGKYECAAIAKYSTFNQPSFYSAMETLINGW